MVRCLVATLNEISKMHVKGSVSLINILTALIYLTLSFDLLPRVAFFLKHVSGRGLNREEGLYLREGLT